MDATIVEDELPTTTAEHRAVLIKWVLNNPIQVQPKHIRDRLKETEGCVVLTRALKL